MQIYLLAGRTAATRPPLAAAVSWETLFPSYLFFNPYAPDCQLVFVLASLPDRRESASERAAAPMKELNCKDVGFDCEGVLHGESEDDVMAQAAVHALAAHGL